MPAAKTVNTVEITANIDVGNEEEKTLAEPAVQSLTYSRRLVVQPR
jgi:hypothetical protein